MRYWEDDWVGFRVPESALNSTTQKKSFDAAELRRYVSRDETVMLLMSQGINSKDLRCSVR